jgi:hypothetical protein
MANTKAGPPPQPEAWRVANFARDLNCSESYVWERVRSGEIPSVKRGAARFILISPSEFLAGQS